MDTQERKVLNLLKRYGAKGISQREAINEIGCYRLSARILELRKKGYIIETKRENNKLGVYTLIATPESHKGLIERVKNFIKGK